MSNGIKKYVCFVRGVHCPSCSVIIEKKLKEIENVESVNLDRDGSRLCINYSGEKKLTAEKLNNIFKKENYLFSEKPILKIKKIGDSLFPLLIGVLIVVSFLSLKSSGLISGIEVDRDSSLSMLFIFGLVAGISGCSTLVGGIILSMSKRWTALSSAESSFKDRFMPYLSFNLGRIIAYSLAGAFLGLIGREINFSPRVGSLMVVAVSLIMIISALQMLEVSWLEKFRLRVPNFLRKFLTAKEEKRKPLSPFLIGAGTLFLPCGFTLTAQGLALISGSIERGFLITTLFALGTLPSLLAISFGAAKIMSKREYAKKFMQSAAVILIFFAIYNINAQLNVFGMTSFEDLFDNQKPTVSSDKKEKKLSEDKNLPPIVDGKQLVKMEADGHGYRPNNFKVKAGIPIRWEIFDKGADGCTNAIISEDLFEGQIKLKKGQTSVKEFTIEKPGKYKFSCWMGMVYGSFEAIK